MLRGLLFYRVSFLRIIYSTWREIDSVFVWLFILWCCCCLFVFFNQISFCLCFLKIWWPLKVWAIVAFQNWQDSAEDVSHDFITMRQKVAAKDSSMVVAVEMEIISKHWKNANKRVSVLSLKQIEISFWICDFFGNTTKTYFKVSETWN